MENSPRSLESAVRRLAPIVLGICVIVGLPGVCQAKNNCPWINEATASGLLGGEAVGEMTDATVGQPATCIFTQIDKGAARTLRISLERTVDPHHVLVSVAAGCGTNGTLLPAIGNEAVTCAINDRKIGLGERVVGRVRDQVFTIALSTTVKDDPVLTREALKARIYIAAEQVSGNLF